MNISLNFRHLMASQSSFSNQRICTDLLWPTSSSLSCKDVTFVLIETLRSFTASQSHSIQYITSDTTCTINCSQFRCMIGSCVSIIQPCYFPQVPHLNGEQFSTNRAKACKCAILRRKPSTACNASFSANFRFRLKCSANHCSRNASKRAQVDSHKKPPLLPAVRTTFCDLQHQDECILAFGIAFPRILGRLANHFSSSTKKAKVSI